MADRPQRLERDPSDKMIGGVASGVAKYFGIDPTIVRVIWAIAVLFGGFGALVYIIMWIIVPESDETQENAAAELEGEPAADPGAGPDAVPDAEGTDRAGEATEN
jgi:phage shock protein PspC (stress-responsive transcriptional regulator)